MDASRGKPVVPRVEVPAKSAKTVQRAEVWCGCCWCLTRLCLACQTIGATCCIYVMVVPFVWLVKEVIAKIRHTTSPDNPFTTSLPSFIAGFCVIYACVVSTYHILFHIKFNRVQRLKWCTIRILFMVPVFSIDAYFSLQYEPSKYKLVYLLTAAREVYEALVLVSFAQFILAFLGDYSNPGPLTLARRLSVEQCEHIGWMSHVLPRRAPGSEFVSKSIYGILQYAFVLVAVVLVEILLWTWSIYDTDPGHEAFRGHIDSFFTIVKTISNTWAVYDLVLFFEAVLHAEVTHEDMQAIKPMNKFLAIKGLVMLTFWQQLLIGVIAPYLPCSGGWSTEMVADGLNNFLLCVEMLAFAEWHRFAYPVQEIMPEREPAGVRGGFFAQIFKHETKESDIGAIGKMAVGVVQNPDRFLRINDLRLQVQDLMTNARAQRAAMRIMHGREYDEHKLIDAFNKHFDHCNTKGNEEKNYRVSKAQLMFLLEVGHRVAEGRPVALLREVADSVKEDGASCEEFLAIARRIQQIPGKQAPPFRTGIPEAPAASLGPAAGGLAQPLLQSLD